MGGMGRMGRMGRMEESFAGFVARKETEAARAVLSPFAADVERCPEDATALGNAWSRQMFDGPFYVSPAPSPDVPATNLVFVQSRDGNTGAGDPSSLGGGEADQHLIYEGLSRVAADAVLAGAETVRSGNLVLSVWHPELVALRDSLGLPRHPIQIVATLRGLNLDGLLFNVPALRVVVLTVSACADLMLTQLSDRPWVTVVLMPTADDLPHAFCRLREMGIVRISCIGGRTLARQLIDARLIQDLYLTKSPKAGGEPGTPLYPGPLEGELLVRKRGTGPDEGVVFEHTRPTWPWRSP
jgi:5-amino-6-(5-phosphoribosylamino)uracil reductase